MQKQNRLNIVADFSFYFLWALTLLLLPLKWVLAWFIASSVHELGHYFSLKAFRIHILSIRLYSGGVEMETEPMETLPIAICSLAGPIFGISLLLLAKQLPYLAICALIQSLYNLLPLYPLDGGRAIQAILTHFQTEYHAKRIMCAVRFITLLLMFVPALYITLTFAKGYLCLLLFILIVLKTTHIKIPCKHS